MTDSYYKNQYTELAENVLTMYEKILSVQQTNNLPLRTVNNAELPYKDLHYVKMLADGYGYQEIAYKEERSPRTVEATVAKLHHKYGVKNNAGLVGIFFRHNWIQ